MDRAQLRNGFVLVSVAGALVLTLAVFLPYLPTLAIAATLAVVFQPMHRRVRRMLGGRNGLAALFSLCLVGIMLLAPLVIIGSQVARETGSLYDILADSSDSVPRDVTRFVEQSIRRIAPRANVEIGSYVQQALTWMGGWLGSVFTATVQTILHFLLGIMALFYFLRDGQKFVAWFIELSPLPDAYDRGIARSLEGAITSIVRGSLLIALIQGALTGLGLALFHVPNAVLWGCIAVLTAFVPSLGTALVLGPAILYLYLGGKTLAAVGLLLWSVMAVGLIDNLLRPVVMGRGAGIHPLFVLFSVLGGIQLFGAVGLILGPLVLSLLVALLEVYRALMKSQSSLSSVSS